MQRPAAIITSAPHGKKPGYFPLVRRRWLEAFALKGFRTQLLITMVYLVWLVIFLNYFFNFIQGRQGITLPDPVLALFHPINFSVEIFSVIYICAIIGIIYLMTVPLRFLRGLEAMAIIYSFRILTLYFARLNPPAGIISLSDPFILHFAYDGRLITKDLFFSGHTASLLLLVLATNKKGLKRLFIAATIGVIYMLLWQRVHYTIDILGALVFTGLIWKLTGLWWPERSLDLKKDSPCEAE